MLGTRDAEVDIVMVQVPELVGTDHLAAARAGEVLTALDAALELRPATMVGRRIQLTRTRILCPPHLSLRRRLDLPRFRPSSIICRNHEESPSGRNEQQCG